MKMKEPSSLQKSYPCSSLPNSFSSFFLFLHLALSFPCFPLSPPLSVFLFHIFFSQPPLKTSPLPLLLKSLFPIQPSSPSSFLSSQKFLFPMQPDFPLCHLSSHGVVILLSSSFLGSLLVSFQNGMGVIFRTYPLYLM